MEAYITFLWSSPHTLILSKIFFILWAHIHKLYKLGVLWCSLFTSFLLISPFDPHLSWQLNLGIHFGIYSILPLVLSCFFSFVVRTKLKEWGASLKGRPRSLPPGLLHQRWQKAVWTIGKCFIGHDTLCSRVRATLNFSLTPSLLHFYCPARLLTNLQPWVHWRV